MIEQMPYKYVLLHSTPVKWSIIMQANVFLDKNRAIW